MLSPEQVGSYGEFGITFESGAAACLGRVKKIGQKKLEGIYACGRYDRYGSVHKRAD